MKLTFDGTADDFETLIGVRPTPEREGPVPVFRLDADIGDRVIVHNGGADSLVEALEGFGRDWVATRPLDAGALPMMYMLTGPDSVVRA